MCFVDPGQAYGLVDRTLLSTVLARFGVPPLVLSAFRHFNDGIRARFRTDFVKYAYWLGVGQGPRRGCVLAPLLSRCSSPDETYEQALFRCWGSRPGVKTVTKFVYIGATVCENADLTSEINRRVLLANLRFRQRRLPLYNQATASLRREVRTLKPEVTEAILRCTGASRGAQRCPISPYCR